MQTIGIICIIVSLFIFGALIISCIKESVKRDEGLDPEEDDEVLWRDSSYDPNWLKPYFPTEYLTQEPTTPQDKQYEWDLKSGGKAPRHVFPDEAYVDTSVKIIDFNDNGSAKIKSSFIDQIEFNGESNIQVIGHDPFTGDRVLPKDDIISKGTFKDAINDMYKMGYKAPFMVYSKQLESGDILSYDKDGYEYMNGIIVKTCPPDYPIPTRFDKEQPKVKPLDECKVIDGGTKSMNLSSPPGYDSTKDYLDKNYPNENG